MKSAILALAMVITAPVLATETTAKHPASQFVHDTLTQGQQILSQKNGEARTQGICSLLNDKLGKGDIAARWLGTYAQIKRDQTAITRFPNLVPSIIISKVLQNIGDREIRGSFTVKDAPKEKAGAFHVEVVISNPAGKQHTGVVVVKSNKITDIFYQNFSAVEGLGSEYQAILDEELSKAPNTALPVSALISRIESEEGYTACR